MKPTLLLLSALFLALKPADDKTDRLGVKGPLKFNNKNFNLSWTDKPKDTYYIQEYLPAGETSEHFNELLTIHLFITDISVEDAMQQKAEELEQRKKYDALCLYKEVNKNSGKENMVAFFLSESKGDNVTVVEFNLYHYTQIKISGNRKALLVYAYSKRAYDDKVMPFLQGINDKPIIDEMLKVGFPKLSI